MVRLRPMVLRKLHRARRSGIRAAGCRLRGGGRSPANSGERSGGRRIRTRAGLHPTRFPSLLSCVRGRSSRSVALVTGHAETWWTLPDVAYETGIETRHEASEP